MKTYQENPDNSQHELFHNSYEQFLKEKIHSSLYHIDAHFEEEEDKVWIVTDSGVHKRIHFKMAFTPEYYDVLLVAALQLLETVIMIEKGERLF